MPVFGLPKERILRGYKAFSDIIAKGNSLTAGSIRLFYSVDAASSPTRAGFSVSRSIRKAAVRNRVKRCLREAVRHNEPLLPSGKYTLVFMYRGEKADRASRVICKDLEKDVVAALNILREKIRT
ncbi:MAG: ribonuclease P protein component [Bacteroidota bacterium]